MATSTPLPDRPSMASIRKQAKMLARSITAGEPAAIARVRAQLPNAPTPVSLRDAQLVLAREYGFTGWPDLQREVLIRSGQGRGWAAVQAEQAIHDDDLERLHEMLHDYTGLVTWRAADGHSLLESRPPMRWTTETPLGKSG